MTPDYYATLGVSPSSDDSEIRSAYLELMRRYHPDRNSSAGAAERARAVTTAYAVLSDWDQRAEYDLKRARLRALEAAINVTPRRPRPSPSALFALGAVALLLVVAIRPPLFVRELPERAAPAAPAAPVRAAAAPKGDPAVHCRSAETRDRIRQELFRRAARLRGKDQAAFDRIAGHALIRIDSPELRQADERLGTVRCEGWVALDLPPGVAVLGGRRNLTADIGYTVTPDRRGRGALTLSNEGLIVTPLATLAEVRASEEPPEPAAIDLAEARPRIEPPPPPRPAAAPPPARIAPQAVRPAPQISKAAAPPARPAARAERAAAPDPAAQPRPSFSCQIARGRGETAVCRNADLARLDRHLGMFYGQSWGQADAARREKLLSTRERFIARRDSCRTDSCISAAYLGRMREISDIMASGN